jgi:hypothetical protein
MPDLPLSGLTKQWQHNYNALCSAAQTTPGCALLGAFIEKHNASVPPTPTLVTLRHYSLPLISAQVLRHLMEKLTESLNNPGSTPNMYAFLAALAKKAPTLSRQLTLIHQNTQRKEYKEMRFFLNNDEEMPLAQMPRLEPSIFEI